MPRHLRPGPREPGQRDAPGDWGVHRTRVGQLLLPGEDSHVQDYRCLKESLSVPRDRGPGSRGPGGDGAERGGDGAHVRPGLLGQQPEVRHVRPVHHCGYEGRNTAFFCQLVTRLTLT